MARKATDLLDIFRFSGESSDGGGKPPAKKSRGGAKRKKAGKQKRSFDGIFLNGRQLLLASSALLLLLVLSFTLGLATGRPGGGGETSELARSSGTRLAIRARLPVVDPATRKAIRPAQVGERLTQDYGIDPGEHPRPAPGHGARHRGGPLPLREPRPELHPEHRPRHGPHPHGEPLPVRRVRALEARPIAGP